MSGTLLNTAIVTARKAQVLLMSLTMALVTTNCFIRASKSNAHATVSPHAAKWNSAIIHFIVYTCAFPTLTGFHKLSTVKELMIKHSTMAITGKDFNLLHQKMCLTNTGMM